MSTLYRKQKKQSETIYQITIVLTISALILWLLLSIFNLFNLVANNSAVAISSIFISLSIGSATILAYLMFNKTQLNNECNTGKKLNKNTYDFLNSISEIVIILDNKKCIKFLNMKAKSTFQNQTCSLIGQPVHDLLADLPPQAASKRSLKEEQPNSLFMQKGEEFTAPIQAALSAMQSEKEKINAPNTELRELEEERFRLQQFSVEHAPDYVFWLDQHAQIIYANETACIDLGYSAVEISMLKAQNLIPSTTLPTWDKLWNLVKEYGSCVFEIDILTNDSIAIPVEVIANSVSLEGKEYICAYVRNVSDRKLGEEQLHKYASELEQKNSALEEFTYITSHNLQEPLRSISSFAQLLSRRYQSQLDEQADEFITFITDGVKQMQHLLRDLSLYAQLNEAPKAFSSVNMEKMLNQSLKKLAPCIQLHQANITFDALPTIKGSEREMMLLFRNLINNALKYRGNDEPNIHIGVVQQNRYWRFHVKDNGIGIPFEYKDKIFNIFKRLHSCVSYKGGTGIGLSICQKIVERHSGEIWTKPNINQDAGTTFYFTIPIS